MVYIWCTNFWTMKFFRSSPTLDFVETLRVYEISAYHIEAVNSFDKSYIFHRKVIYVIIYPQHRASLIFVVWFFFARISYLRHVSRVSRIEYTSWVIRSCGECLYLVLEERHWWKQNKYWKMCENITDNNLRVFSII